MVDYQVGSGTLWIKLKISENDVLEDHNKQDHQYEDEDVEVQIPKHDDNRRRICDVCNKGFSSGKALGGHMRIHVQAAKKHLISGKKDKKSKPLVTTYYKKRILQRDEEEDLGNYNNDRLLPTCSICGKNFPSMKSLFGHMRCHPERAWRGIQPPHLKSRNEIHKKTASAPATVAVPGWSVTAKRGRKPNAEEAINSCSKDEEQLHDAVHHLMLLAKGDSVESGLTGGGGCVNKHNDIPEELEKTNSNSLTSKAENEEFAYHHISESKMIDNRKRRKKKMKIRFLNSVQESASVLHPARAAASSSEKYKCSTCGKSFATYQALGGHKSSHNKFSMVIQNSDVTNVAPATSEEAAATSSSKLLADSKLCYFPTSRCQWRSPIDHQIGPSSSQLTSPGEFNHTTGRRILDFDLNELPSDHEDELAGNHEYFSFFPI